MGQYWKVVNLDKREFVDPHKLGAGLKLWEQLATHPGTGAALIVLCAAMPEARGRGDLDLDWEIAGRTIGRWTGDRVALVGDYAESGDLSEADQAHLIYRLCQSPAEIAESVSHRRGIPRDARENGGMLYGRSAEEWEAEADELESAAPYRDISADVCAVIEHELGGKFVGDGWREFVYTEEK